MTKARDAIVETLLAGQPGEIYVPEDGDLASMRGILKHRQVLTLAPVTDFRAVQANDIVLVKWRGGNTILHVVQEVQGEQFLIANSLGKINGWVHGSDILGRVTKILEPEPLPGIPEMLEQLRAAFQKLVELTQAMSRQPGGCSPCWKICSGMPGGSVRSVGRNSPGKINTAFAGIYGISPGRPKK